MQLRPSVVFIPTRSKPTFLCNETQLFHYITKALNENSPHTCITASDTDLNICIQSELLVDIDPINSLSEVVNGTSYKLEKGQSFRTRHLIKTAANRFMYLSNDFVRVSICVITKEDYKGPRIRCETSLPEEKCKGNIFYDFFKQAFFGKSKYNR